MKNLTFLLLSSILLLACGNSDKKKNSSSNIKDIEGSIPTELIGDAVEKYNGKLDELLTLEMAASALELPAGEAEKDYEQTLKSPTFHSISYKWDNGRTKMLNLPSGSKFEMPAPDMVGLSWFQESNLDKFKNSYREPTQEELAALDRILGEETEKMGLTDEVGETMKDGMEDGLTSDLEFTDVNGVGELARWNSKTNELPVYYKGMSFIIEVESGMGSEVNKDIAVQVAKQIVKKL